jgi:hypothetical protein
VGQAGERRRHPIQRPPVVNTNTNNKAFFKKKKAIYEKKKMKLNQSDFSVDLALGDGHDLARGLDVQVIDQQHSAQDSIALERLHMHIALCV